MKLVFSTEILSDLHCVKFLLRTGICYNADAASDSNYLAIQFF